MYGSGVSEMWISGRKGQSGGHVKECWSEVCLSKEKVEFVYLIRGWLQEKGYREDEYFIKV
jgi:hypothetical protein